MSILKAWKSVQSVPFGLGPWCFQWLVLLKAPYSWTVFPRVVDLKEGYCRVQIKERAILKNPFNSIHAVALANVGELTSGLSMMSALDSQGLRGIVTKLETEYVKKAKGASLCAGRLVVLMLFG